MLGESTTSSVTRDIWMYNPETKEHTQLTDFEGEDRNPVWSKDELSFTTYLRSQEVLIFGRKRFRMEAKHK